MRHLFILAWVLTLGSCGQTDRDYRRFFNNESWTFKVDSSLRNSVGSFTLNFFGDSLYVYEYYEDSIKLTQLGKWRIEKTWFGDRFVMLDQGFTSKYKIGDFSVDEISISDGTSRLIGIRVRQTDTIEIQHLNGTWVGKTDSLLNSKKLYQQSGKFLTTPIFNFKADSFSIYTFDYYDSGMWTLRGTNKDVVVLEKQRQYDYNDNLNILYLNSDSLAIRFHHRIGLNHKELYWLIRKN